MTVKELYAAIGGNYEELKIRIPHEDKFDKFIKTYASNAEVESMINAYKEGDYANVFEYSHNLKGSSANLSLNRMNETFVKICEAVRHGEPSEDISAYIEQARSDHEELKQLVLKLA